MLSLGRQTHHSPINTNENRAKKKTQAKHNREKTFSLLFHSFVMIECNVHTVQASVKHCRYGKCTLFCLKTNPLNFLNLESKKFMGFHEMFANLFRSINRFRFSFNSRTVNLYFVLVCVFCLLSIWNCIYKFLFIVTAPHGDRFRNDLINLLFAVKLGFSYHIYSVSSFARES